MLLLQWVASHLLCLMILTHIAREPGQGKGSPSVWSEPGSSRICQSLQPSHLSHLAMTMTPSIKLDSRVESDLTAVWSTSYI